MLSATLFCCITPLLSFAHSKLSHSHLLLLSWLAATHPWEKEELPVSSAALLMPTLFITANAAWEQKNQYLCASSGHCHHHVCPVALLSVHADTLFSIPYVLIKWCRRRHVAQWWCNDGFQHCRLPILYSIVCIVKCSIVQFDTPPWCCQEFLHASLVNRIRASGVTPGNLLSVLLS